MEEADIEQLSMRFGFLKFFFKVKVKDKINSHIRFFSLFSMLYICKIFK